MNKAFTIQLTSTLQPKGREMRKPSNNQPSMEELAQDAERQAEIAAQVFQADGKDRYDRENNFVYRHFMVFIGIGIAMAMVPFFAMVFLGSTLKFASADSNILWMLIAVSLAGIFVILFTVVRGNSEKWFTAWTVTSGVFIALLVLAGIGAAVYMAAMHAVLQ